MRQSYDIFQTFGKDPDALTNITLGFDLALREYDQHWIDDAFKEWLKSASRMPTPSDIIRILKEEMETESDKRREYFTAPERPKSAGVPWAHMEYREVIQNGFLNAVRQHVRSLAQESADKAADYCKYLKTQCKFPASFMEATP